MRRYSQIYGLLVALMFAFTAILPAQAKGMPTFFTVEGPGIETPIPFVLQPVTSADEFAAAISVPPAKTGGIYDLFNADEALSVAEEALGDYYIISAYVIVEDELDGSTNLFGHMLAPMHYYPQQDGPGIVKFIGPEGAYSEYDNRFYTIAAPLEQSVQQALALGQWVSLLDEAP